MLCTKECYDKLVDFYFKNIKSLHERNLSDVYERVLFLIKNIEYKSIIDIQIEHETISSRNITSIYDVANTYENIVLTCYDLIKDEYGDEYPNFAMTLILKSEEHYKGFCECSPTDKGYYVEHDCCGIRCDYSEYYFVVNHNNGGELRVENYKEYMFFDFLRELKGKKSLIEDSKINEIKAKIQNYYTIIDSLNSELEKLIKLE